MTKNNEDLKDLIQVTEWRAFVYQYIFYQEYILRSAIAVLNKETNECVSIYSVAAPGHHHEVLCFITDQNKESENQSRVQGFLTNKGRFVTRKEAYLIALTAKQIIVNHGNGSDLFSEQMWNLTEEKDSFRDLYLNHWTNPVIECLAKAYRKLKKD